MTNLPYRRLLSSILYVLLFCVLLFPLAIYFGAEPRTLSNYFLYVVFFNIIPGTLFYCCLVEDWHLVSGLPVIGWVVGLSLETVVFNLLDHVHLRTFFYLYPLLSVAFGVLVLTFRHHRDRETTDLKSLFHPAFLLITAVSLVFIAFDRLTNVGEFEFNTNVQAYISNTILLGSPYQIFEGVPLLYNYLIHTHIAAASIFTNIGPVELSSRVAPFFLLLLCLLTIYYTGINLYKNKWTGLLVIAQIFCVIGRQPILEGFFASAIPNATVTLLSPIAAFPIFLVLVSETFNTATTSKSNYIKLSYGRFAIIALLLWSASGMRAPAIISYGAGLGVLAVWNYGRHRIISWNLLFLILFSVILFGFSLIWFYGFLSPYSATHFLQFIPGPAYSFESTHLRLFSIIRHIKHIRLPYYICGVLTFVVILIGKATFLDGGIFWLLKSKQLAKYDVDVFWCGVTICGFLFLYFTYAGGGSNYTFLQYAQFALAFVGARGLCEYLAQQDFYKRSVVVIVVTLGLGLLQFGETVSIFTKDAEAAQPKDAGSAGVSGDDYMLLSNYLKTNTSTKCPYVLVDDNGSWGGLALSAELTGLRQYATEFYLKTKLTPGATNDDLQNRLDFVDALVRMSRQKTMTDADITVEKNKRNIHQCLTVLFDLKNGIESKTLIGKDWTFKVGRFAVLQL